MGMDSVIRYLHRGYYENVMGNDRNVCEYILLNNVNILRIIHYRFLCFEFETFKSI